MESRSSRRGTIAGAVLVLIVLCLAASAPARVAEEWSIPLEVGEMAPDFALADSRGREVRLSRFAQGKYVILDFYMGWF